MTDCLAAGVERHPERVLVAQRDAQGNWIEITYREMLARARAIGQALLGRKVGETVSLNTEHGAADATIGSIQAAPPDQITPTPQPATESAVEAAVAE